MTYFPPHSLPSLFLKRLMSITFIAIPIKCSDELHSFVHLDQSFTTTSHHTTSTEWSQPHFLRIPNLKRMLFLFPNKCYFEQNSCLNTIRKNQDLNLLKLKINRYISSLSSQSPLPTTSIFTVANPLL